MTTIATLGPEGSLDWEAARRYDPASQARRLSRTSAR